jgi:hypothetical protein
MQLCSSNHTTVNTRSFHVEVPSKRKKKRGHRNRLTLADDVKERRHELSDEFVSYDEGSLCDGILMDVELVCFQVW